MRGSYALWATLALGLSGCAALATGTSNPADAIAIMREQNARGCIYIRASATPWAQATTILIGTWGQDPPPYADCWKGVPASIP